MIRGVIHCERWAKGCGELRVRSLCSHLFVVWRGKDDWVVDESSGWASAAAGGLFVQ
jgi:hypothetical protein